MITAAFKTNCRSVTNIIEKSDLDHGHERVSGDPEGEGEHRVLLVVVGLELAHHVVAVDAALDAPGWSD